MVWYLIGGFLLGILFMLLVGRIRNDGDLVIYIPDDPDEPMYPQLEGNRSLEVLMAKKRVTFNVVSRKLHSQK